jgi:hypothetical protein
MKKILNLNNIFQNCCTYDIVNGLSDVKLRNVENGLCITDALLYKFKYAQIGTTKDSIVSSINIYNKENNICNKSFTRRSFECKERNIGTQFYSNILNKIIDFYNTNCNSKNKNEYIFMAIDGTNNNDNKQNIMLNMGYFDIKNKIPIDLTNNGTEYRNKEVEVVINDITAHPDKYKNVVIIGDRLYFTYEFMNFLDSQNIKFIVRAKGKADNLDDMCDLKKSTKHYDIIKELRKKIRIVKCFNTYDKIVFSSKSKKITNKIYHLKVVNDCVIITNLLDKSKFSDSDILDLYRKRWEIEIFFKFLKKNFKVQFINESDVRQYQRSFICEMILVYILKIFQYYYLKTKTINVQQDKSFKFNDSLLMTGIFDSLLRSIIEGHLTENQINHFCESYFKIIINKKDRRFPRTAKRPFCKWYLKGYSASTRLVKILETIETGKIDDLNKNLKLIAKRITIIRIDNS